MSVEKIITSRGITEIVHYTSEEGLTGVLATCALKCKNKLRCDQYIEHILKINTQKEFDPEWNTHVHLSISTINSWLFGFSAGRWHTQAKWRILAFDPVILTHSDVHFVTTNNAYKDHLSRDKGAKGLEALFAGKVKSRYGREICRLPTIASNLTTDPQAEVLYPDAVSTQFLRRIYVATEADENAVAAQLHVFKYTGIDLSVAPEKFASWTT